MKTLSLVGLTLTALSLTTIEAKDLSSGGVSMKSATKVFDSVLSRKALLGSTNASQDVKDMEKKAAGHKTNLLDLQGVEEALQINSESVTLNFRF